MNMGFTADPTLVLDFLRTFSRLEYSLKVTRFRQPGDGEARANWKGFVAEISPHFNPDSSPELASAYRYLTHNPPRTLEVKDDAVSWVAYVPKVGSSANEAVWIIKQVRNNLFHGGKFAIDPTASLQRDSELLRAGKVLLDYFVSIVPEVDRAFQQ
jgi:hypothetical protein